MFLDGWGQEDGNGETTLDRMRPDKIAKWLKDGKPEVFDYLADYQQDGNKTEHLAHQRFNGYKHSYDLK